MTDYSGVAEWIGAISRLADESAARILCDYGVDVREILPSVGETDSEYLDRLVAAITTQ